MIETQRHRGTEIDNNLMIKVLSAFVPLCLIFVANISGNDGIKLFFHLCNFPKKLIY